MENKMCRPYKPWLTANDGSTSFTAPSPLFNAEPSSNIQRVCQTSSGYIPKEVLLIFFGAGDANDVFDARLYGWHRVPNGPNHFDFVPTLLADLSCTLGATTGVAGAHVGASELYVDTISINTQWETVANTTNDGTIELMSPASDLIAHVAIPIWGSEILQLDFDMTTGDPTGGNALFALY